MYPPKRTRIIGRLLYFPFRLLFQSSAITKRAEAEARTISVTRKTLELRQWPSAFEGLTVAFLTDLHCGPLTTAAFLAEVVEETNRLRPDVILLGGDYVTLNARYVRPVVEVLAKLKAPRGIYSVLGNHDHKVAPDLIRAGLAHVGIFDVNNSGQWLAAGDDRIRIAGVGDLRRDKQDLDAALDGATEEDAAILLSHNPDYAVTLADPRVRLVLSGHTHGGQIILPRVGPLVTNSMYGTRLLSGLISLDGFQLYVSRGIGTVGLPIRYHCPPEIVFLTLT